MPASDRGTRRCARRRSRTPRDRRATAASSPRRPRRPRRRSSPTAGRATACMCAGNATPALYVVHLETIALEHRDRIADVVELAAGEKVLRQRGELRPLTAERLIVALARPSDRLLEEQPIAFEHPPHGRVIFRIIVDTDVLLQADRRDFVELPFDTRVVLQLNPHLVL